MKKIVGYTCEPLNKIIESRNDCVFPGASVHLCNAKWKKECNNHCCLFFPDGSLFWEKKLAILLKKTVSKLTTHDRYILKHQFEAAAFKKCRPVTIEIKEGGK